MKRNYIKKITLGLALIMCMGFVTPVHARSKFKGEYRQGEILSFGSSLNDSEEKALREYFGVPSNMKAIYVDDATAIKQFGLEPNALDDYTGGWYSSAYVKLTNKGGVDVESKNVTLVTDEMFANALITSGITNCKVNVSAPFNVSGESALAGILAGAEEIMGEKLSEENKGVAQDEIDTTLEIADEILNNKDNEINNTGDSSTVASGIINDIKEQVIKDSPNSTQIQEIIINVTNNYGVELSKESNAKVLNLMEDVNKLDIEYKDIKETMSNIGESISANIKEAGLKLKESGIFEKIGNWFADLFRSIGNWFVSLFESDEVEENVQEEQVTTENDVELNESSEVIVSEEVIENIESIENVEENNSENNEEAEESNGAENSEELEASTENEMYLDEENNTFENSEDDKVEAEVIGEAKEETVEDI